MKKSNIKMQKSKLRTMKNLIFVILSVAKDLLSRIRFFPRRIVWGRMTRKFFNFGLSFLILLFGFWACAYAEGWQILKGEHFIVHFFGDERFAKEVLRKAEIYYGDIASDLGYARRSAFWTWDNRVKIYIYPERDSYLKATGQPDWSEGMADYRSKEIASYAQSEEFLESILPHEMAHLIFRDFVGFKGEISLWLDEGVAQWEEKARREKIKTMAKQYFDKDMLLPIRDIIKMDLSRIKDKELVIRVIRTKKDTKGILVLSGDDLVTAFYLQSASLVGFLIEKYGSESFADFCRQLRDGKTLDEALKFAYPTHIRSADELGNKWREYLENRN